MKKAVKKTESISERFIDQLYSIDIDFIDEKGEKLEIEESGFLGLLATGYRGTVMLRKKRGQTHLYSKFTKGKQALSKQNRSKDR